MTGTTESEAPVVRRRATRFQLVVRIAFAVLWVLGLLWIVTMHPRVDAEGWYSPAGADPTAIAILATVGVLVLVASGWAVSRREPSGARSVWLLACAWFLSLVALFVLVSPFDATFWTPIVWVGMLAVPTLIAFAVPTLIGVAVGSLLRGRADPA